MYNGKKLNDKQHFLQSQGKLQNRLHEENNLKTAYLSYRLSPFTPEDEN